MKGHQREISNVEWGLVIGVLLTIDLGQIVLDWMFIGVVLNPIIDAFTGMSFALYLHISGQSMGDPKRAFSLIATFLVEMVPGLDELPLWCLDGIYAMGLAKKDKILNAVSADVNSKFGKNQEKKP